MSPNVKLSIIRQQLEATLETYRFLNQKLPSDYARGLIEGIEHALHLIKLVTDEEERINHPKSEG